MGMVLSIFYAQVRSWNRPRASLAGKWLGLGLMRLDMIVIKWSRRLRSYVQVKVVCNQENKWLSRFYQQTNAKAKEQRRCFVQTVTMLCRKRLAKSVLRQKNAPSSSSFQPFWCTLFWLSLSFKMRFE